MSDLRKRIKEHFDSLEPGELDAWIEDYNSRPSCDPETCEGQCQGMGACQDCVDFREEHGIVLPSLGDLIALCEEEERQRNQR